MPFKKKQYQISSTEIQPKQNEDSVLKKNQEVARTFFEGLFGATCRHVVFSQSHSILLNRKAFFLKRSQKKP